MIGRMRSTTRLLRILAILAFLHAHASADDVWTFQFTPNGSRPYYIGCDACSASYQGTRADIAGTFSILLNWQNGTGRLIELNDHLVNTATIVYSPSGNILQPNNPPDLLEGIAPSYYSLPQVPGHFSLQNRYWRLLPDSSTTTGPISDALYDIWFSKTAAAFNMTLPIMDAMPIVTNASAEFRSTSLAGDYNGDTRVDALDYVAWRKNAGSPAGYDLWRTYFQSTVLSPSSTAPEPATSVLLVAAAACGLLHRRRSALT